MHKIYHTHGFVLSSRNVGEANKLIFIYTREMGLVRATVQGIRLAKSKLRYALQDFSYAKIDLVQGRDIWRVTSATTVDSFPYVRSDRQSLVLIARVVKLLERLCDGEESNTRIFDDLINSLRMLDDEGISPVFREALELHLVLRIMHSLGYIEESAIFNNYLDADFSISKIDSLIKEKRSIVTHINKALNESQL